MNNHVFVVLNALDDSRIPQKKIREPEKPQLMQQQQGHKRFIFVWNIYGNRLQIQPKALRETNQELVIPLLVLFGQPGESLIHESLKVIFKRLSRLILRIHEFMNARKGFANTPI